MTLSTRLREGTRDAHRAIERAPLLRELLRATLDERTYAAYLRSLYSVYQALERGPARAFLSSFVPEFLCRAPALADDLRDFDAGERLPAAPAAIELRDRIVYASERRPVLLLAHAYVRYMGDLGGGPILGKATRRCFPCRSTRFYEFDHHTDAAQEAARIRARLDTVPEYDVEDIVAEANRAFEANARVLAQCHAAPASVAAPAFVAVAATAR